MKKVVDVKTGRKITIFQEYKLNNSLVCPECGRPLKDFDVKNLEERGKISCVKCGAKLVK